MGLKDTDDGFFSALEAAAEADFLAVVNRHTDEEQLFYFFLFKGKKMSTNEFFEFSIAEIDPYPISVLPLDSGLGNDTLKGWHYDDFEEAFNNARRGR